MKFILIAYVLCLAGCSGLTVTLTPNDINAIADATSKRTTENVEVALEADAKLSEETIDDIGNVLGTVVSTAVNSASPIKVDGIETLVGTLIGGGAAALGITKTAKKLKESGPGSYFGNKKSSPS